MHATLEQIGLVGIVPVIAIDNAEDAQPLAQALIEGGLPCAEVTFRTAAAKEAMTRIAKKFPAMLMGAGTVLSVEQAKTAVDCGAKYIVSPGLNRSVVEYCLANGIAVTPGVATPTEVGNAIELGVEVVKFFPAEANGGVEYLKALAAPYKGVKFIPTGGIDATNLLSYLKLPYVLACGGSWMVKSNLINAKQFDEIKRLSAQAVQKMLGFELRHIGIDNSSAEEAMKGAAKLSSLLQMPINDGNSSVFVGTQFEFLKQMDPGKNSHIAIGTNFIERAVAYFARQGVGINKETRDEKNGKLATVYLNLEVGSFGIHLVQV